MDWLKRFFDKILSLWPAVIMVDPSERAVRITCGKWPKTLGPGWYLMWPIIQIMYKCDVMTQVVDLAPQTVTTKDGHCLVVSGALRYHITDIYKTLLNVHDVDKALSVLSLGVILDYISTKTLAECYNRDAIKGELRTALAAEASNWGIKIEKIYLTDYGRVRSIRLFGDNMRASNGCGG